MQVFLKVKYQNLLLGKLIAIEMTMKLFIYLFSYLVFCLLD